MPRSWTRASSPMTNDHGKATEAYEEVVPEAEPQAPSSEEPDVTLDEEAIEAIEAEEAPAAEDAEAPRGGARRGGAGRRAGGPRRQVPLAGPAHAGRFRELPQARLA